MLRSYFNETMKGQFDQCIVVLMWEHSLTIDSIKDKPQCNN